MGISASLIFSNPLKVSAFSWDLADSFMFVNNSKSLSYLSDRVINSSQVDIGSGSSKVTELNAVIVSISSVVSLELSKETFNIRERVNLNSELLILNSMALVSM